MRSRGQHNDFTKFSDFARSYAKAEHSQTLREHLFIVNKWPTNAPNTNTHAHTRYFCSRVKSSNEKH